VDAEERPVALVARLVFDPELTGRIGAHPVQYRTEAHRAAGGEDYVQPLHGLSRLRVEYEAFDDGGARIAPKHVTTCQTEREGYRERDTHVIARRQNSGPFTRAASTARQAARETWTTRARQRSARRRS